VTAHFSRSPAIAIVEKPHSVLILALGDPASQVPVVLEGTARDIWDRLSTTQTLDSLVESIYSDFDASSATVVDEISSFLDSLVAASLLVQVEAS